MNEKIKRFLIRSSICLIIECVIVFGWLAWYMTRKTKRTISEISEIYMYEMNVQLQQKFSSLIKLRLEQVEGIIRRTPPEEDDPGEQLREQIIRELETSSQIRGFSYLGFYTEDDTLETIYGPDIEIVTAGDVRESLEEDGNLVEQGYDENQEQLLLLGKAVEYQIADGRKSLALVAGVSMDYLNEAMYLDTGNSQVYSHIIDKNGRFVIRSGDVRWDSYYDRIMYDYEALDGKTPGHYLEELQAAIESKDVYFTFISVDGGRRQIYCSPIASYSSWYLISVMPDGDYSKSVSHLDTIRIGMLIGSSLVLLLSMAVVFVQYFALSQQQMKELNRAKQEADRASRAKTEFLSSMSHDIRTPMNGIIGMTEIALKNRQDSERVEDCLKKVQLSSKHLLGLINDVLDMSKIESGNMALHVGVVSLRELMEDIVNIIQPQVKAKGQQFHVSVQDMEADYIYCDSVRLNQVLLNILSNAVKFTPDGGRVEIELRQEASPGRENFVRTHFGIRDNGIGMSKEFQKQIFHSFSRENTEQVQNIAGTGLGMAITKSIVEMMDGTIELESEQGKGSEFRVTLDFARAEETEADIGKPEIAPGDGEPAVLEGKRILVAEDVDLNWEIANEILSSVGLQAERAVNGQVCVEMFSQSEPGYYDMILMDIRMPVMSGYDAARAIRKLARPDAGVPIFAMTADAFSGDIQCSLDSGMDGHIAKPIDVKELMQVLERYLK